MDFALTENQESIRDAVAKICAHFDDAYWLKKDKEGGFPNDFYRAIADAGWLGICFPEEYGGAGLGVLEASIMMRTIAESGAGMSGASAVHINVFGLKPVAVFGTKEQCARMLPGIISGKEKSCFGVTEPNTGLNTTQLKTRAVRKGDKSRQRAEGVDLDCAGRRQDPALGAHHTARRGQEPNPRLEPVLHRLRPQTRHGA
jgi:acyl-CoA dehydrogenase